jgi:hypothetical protein
MSLGVVLPAEANNITIPETRADPGNLTSRLWSKDPLEEGPELRHDPSA